jgi:small-conductance mechanosensitive channel
MAEDKGNDSLLEGLWRADDLGARIAAIETRLDRIDTALKTLDARNIPEQQNLLNKKHEKLLSEQKREIESIREQTRSLTADKYEASKAWDLVFVILLIIIVIIIYSVTPPR